MVDWNEMIDRLSDMRLYFIARWSEVEDQDEKDRCERFIHAIYNIMELLCDLRELDAEEDDGK